MKKITGQKSPSKTFYFIAGLPRSGSTLLCNILAQNPRFHTGGTSGLIELLGGVKNGWDNVLTMRATIDAQTSQRKAANVLYSMMEGFYMDVDKPVIFDKNRGWYRMAETLQMILPSHEVKIISPVRDIRDIMASFEQAHRRQSALGITTQERSNPHAFASVQARCGVWEQGDQPFGAAYIALQDALARGWKESIHFVRYEDLTGHPESAMGNLYDFLGEEEFKHDFDNVQQVTQEDDRFHGFSDLHKIATKVEKRPSKWREVLGAPVAKQYANKELW